MPPSKILLLSPVPLTRPTDGVRLRGLALGSALRPLGDLKTLSFDDGSERGDCPLPAFPGDWERLISPTPSLVRCFSSAQFFQLVARESVNCRACYCLGLQMFQYASALSPGIPVVLDNINVESNILWGLAGRRRGLKRLYWMLQALKLQFYERQALARASAVLAISQADKARFLELAPGANVTILPPGLELSHLLHLRNQAVPGRLLFVGALDWHVNVEACEWLARQVFPKIKAARVDATLQLVGKRPSEKVLALRSIPGVSVHGDVPEIAPFLNEASAVVVPLQYGSGVQNKVIEALASGRPVVTTPVGLEGLDLTPGTHLLVADSAESMKEGCLRLLNDRPMAESLGQRGRSAVEERYTTDRLCRDVKTLQERLSV